PIYRDTLAEQITGDYRADAIATGGHVEVASAHPENTPETLGLLAHEFAHVARQRDPRFIPPIARTQPGQSSVMGEEALARRVESRVKRTAQARVDRLEPLASEPVHGSEALPTGEMRSMSAPHSRDERENWGGLPAPWEPLPDWFVAQPPAAENGVSYVTSMSQPDRLMGGTQGGERAATLAGSSIGTSDVLSQRAGIERGSDEEETQAPSQLSTDTLQAPEPDLDALAQQVYTRLKRRLGVEYRREG
ncbi:MAG TPA: DUF4157 domain-containing protein, partial [Ktedonobacteraceae bacterium]|nr:DUF4157 domain-containing protein [Ktedonobacteraceae bacterium]